MILLPLYRDTYCIVNVVEFWWSPGSCSADDSVTTEREPGEVVDSLVGKQVEYAKEDGGKRSGMVIHQVEAKPSVYFIKFDDDFHIYVYDLVKTS